jgi:uncharacterized membrane protein
MNHAIIGAAIGVAAVLIWVLFGPWVLLVAALVGGAGYLGGMVLDRPGRVIEFLQRLER